MNIGIWLTSATSTLNTAGIGTARLDALVLLEDVTKIDRGRLLAEPELELSSDDISKLTNLLNRRVTHEPLAYVRGKTEFYGREFVITSDVLEPRPESETMIDLLKKHIGIVRQPATGNAPDKEYTLADVGSGSGALGISALMELPDLHVNLLDIDEKALNVSNINVDLFTLSITTIKSDLLANTDRVYDILLCNLPYVPDGYQINSAAMHEPRIAIFGGSDGLEIYRRLFEQLKTRSSKPLLILTESLPPQHADLESIAKTCGYALIDQEDFIQVFTLS